MTTLLLTYIAVLIRCAIRYWRRFSSATTLTIYSPRIWLTGGICVVSPGAMVLAQQVVLHGQIVDAHTQRPLPNAQIGVAQNRIGTTTNADGRFALVIPQAYQHSTLQVMLLGYTPYQTVLNGGVERALRIALIPRSTALQEVTISGSVLGIVREAVARIPHNYPVRPTRLDGFFREADTSLPTGSHLYVAEAALSVYKPSYTQPHDAGAIVVRQSRKIDLVPQTQLGRTMWYAGPFIPQRFDFVHRRLDFINVASFSKYEYRLTDLTTYGGRSVYVIAFGPKAGQHQVDFVGRLYIDQDSYAFLAGEWQQTPAGIQHEGLKFGVEERRYRVDYQRYAGRWHIKSVYYQTTGRGASGPALRHIADYVTTAVDTSHQVPPTYAERAQFRDVFLIKAQPYDSAYWQHHTILLPSDTLLRTLQNPEYDQQTDRWFTQATATRRVGIQRAVLAALSRMRYGVGVGMLPLHATSTAVEVSYTPPGSGFAATALRSAPGQHGAVWYGGSWQVDLLPQIAVRYASRRLVGPYRGKGTEIGATYEWNIRPRHRPVLVRVGAGQLTQRIRYGVGTFANPDASLRVEGTTLNASQLRLSWQRRIRAWVPQVGLGIELSHRVEVTADVGMLVGQRTRDELHLAEAQGFLLTRNQVSIPATATGVHGAGAATPWKVQQPLITLHMLYRLH